MSILTTAQHHIEDLVGDLKGEDDFMPFLMCRRAEQVHYLGLADMSRDTKDDVADVMMAATMVTRADEAIFASSAWAAAMPEDGKLTVAPSEDANRREIVILAHVTRDGEAAYTATLHRRDNRVLLGAWQRMEKVLPGGRFPDALRSGMTLGSRLSEVGWLPDDLDGEELIEWLQPALRAIKRVRAGEEAFDDDDV